MQSILIDCSFCQWNGILNNYQVIFTIFIFFQKYSIVLYLKDHLDETHSNPKCPHCDKQFNSVSELNVHKTSECEKVTVDCILKDLSCNEQVCNSPFHLGVSHFRYFFYFSKNRRFIIIIINEIIYFFNAKIDLFGAL